MSIQLLIGKNANNSYRFGRSSTNHLIYSKEISELPTKTELLSLDYLYDGLPFVSIVSKNQNTGTLDILYNGQIFSGAT